MESYGLSTVGMLTAPPDHIMRLLRSGLGLTQILETCPEVSAAEVDRLLFYTASIASAQANSIKPIVAEDDDEDEDEDERPRKKRKKKPRKIL